MQDEKYLYLRNKKGSFFSVVTVGISKFAIIIFGKSDYHNLNKDIQQLVKPGNSFQIEVHQTPRSIKISLSYINSFRLHSVYCDLKTNTLEIDEVHCISIRQRIDYQVFQ